MRLTKSQITEKQQFVKQLRTDWRAARNSKTMAQQRELLKPLNRTLDKTRRFVDSISKEIDSFIDSKSETWQNSDRGLAAEEMLAAWDCFVDDFESVTLYDIGTDENPADALADLPDSPED